MSITTDRNVFIGGHFTEEQKENFRHEAERRDISMSELLSNIIGDWLIVAADEQIEPKRSNKRHLNPNEVDVPLPFEKEK